MKHDRLVSGTRKPVNLSIDTGIVAAAREAGLNLSKISEAALREATGAEQGRRWQEEHRGDGRVEPLGGEERIAACASASFLMRPDR